MPFCTKSFDCKVLKLIFCTHNVKHICSKLSPVKGRTNDPCYTADNTPGTFVVQIKIISRKLSFCNREPDDDDNDNRRVRSGTDEFRVRDLGTPANPTAAV